jgi:hypothetical protein
MVMDSQFTDPESLRRQYQNPRNIQQFLESITGNQGSDLAQPPAPPPIQLPDPQPPRGPREPPLDPDGVPMDDYPVPPVI